MADQPQDINLDTLDVWQEVAENLSVEIVAHFDRDHTKAEHAEMLRRVSRRLSLLAAAMWAVGHRFEDGHWTPPSRYMRHMAAGHPPVPAERALSEPSDV